MTLSENVSNWCEYQKLRYVYSFTSVFDLILRFLILYYENVFTDERSESYS